MMDKFYKKFSEFLIRNHCIEKDERELYEYAAKVFFQGFANVVIFVLIGIMFAMIKECLSFVSVFIVLRKFTGGLHARKYSHCLISSTILTIISLIAVRLLEKGTFQITYMCLTIIAVVIICALSPVENKNKPLSKKEMQVYKAISTILSLTLLAIICFFWLHKLAVLYSIGNGIIAVSVLIVPTYLKNPFLSRDCSIRKKCNLKLRK